MFGLAFGLVVELGEGVLVGLDLALDGGLAFLSSLMFVETRFSERAIAVSWVLMTVTGWFSVIPPPPKNGGGKGPGNGPGKPKNPPPPRTEPVG